jgi:hypothetical protein
MAGRNTSRPRFRLSPPEPREDEIHASCARALDLLLLPPAVWCCYPAGHLKLSSAEVARLSRLGLRRGLPDLLVFHNATWGIELKRHGMGLSKTRMGRTARGAPKVLIGQDVMFPRLIASGGFAAIATCHSVQEMLDQLAAWDVPLRPGVIAA